LSARSATDVPFGPSVEFDRSITRYKCSFSERVVSPSLSRFPDERVRRLGAGDAPRRLRPRRREVRAQNARARARALPRWPRALLQRR
jgi:hypothetical protein